MKQRDLKAALFAATLFTVPGFAAAQSAPAPNVYIPNVEDIMKASGIFFAGYAAAGYTADLNGGNSLGDHIFDGNGTLGESANSFSLNQVGLLAARVPDEGVGFKVLVIGGSDAKVLNAFYNLGSSGGAPPSNSDFALFIAYGSYTQGPLTLIGGRFPALSGYELAPTVLNTQISRSLVLYLAQPVAEEGVRVNYAFTPTLTGTVSVINSDSNAKIATTEDDNATKTVEFGGTFAAPSGAKLAIYDYYGIDNPSNGGKKNYVDLVASYPLTPSLSVAINGDYVKQFEYKADNTASSTLGLAAYVNYTITPHYLVSLRGEDVQINDDTAHRSFDNIKEVTLTGVYTYNPNLQFKVEGRYDLASSTLNGASGLAVEDFDNGVLPTGGEKYSQHQGELEAMAIFNFGGL